MTNYSEKLRKNSLGKRSEAATKAAESKMHITTRFLLNGTQALISEPKQPAAVRKVQSVEEKSLETP